MSEKRLYGSSTIKTTRRTQNEIAAIKGHIWQALSHDNPMTLRGLFYRLVSDGVIAKTELDYKKIGRYLLQMRRAGEAEYGWVADGTRWMRKNPSYTSVLAVLHAAKDAYRRAIWREQGVYVEVWIEKDALAGVVVQETNAWDVPLMVSRGFSSETFLYEAAQAIRHRRVPSYIYVLTDYDPSGLGIAAQIETGMRRLAPDIELTVQRIAVTPEQIADLSLPTRPTKKSDSRAKNFEGESVELDAIPAGTLRAMVREAIERHVDYDLLRQTRAVEKLERGTLEHLIANWPGLTAA